MYVKVTKLIKWGHLYMWLLQRINRLKPLKHPKIRQIVYSSLSVYLI
jgi:hypothetical protein